MEIDADIHDAKRMKPKGFGCPLTSLAPPEG